MNRRGFLCGLLALPAAGAYAATQTVLDFETQARSAVQASHPLTLIDVAKAQQDDQVDALIQIFNADNELLKALPWKEEPL